MERQYRTERIIQRAALRLEQSQRVMANHAAEHRRASARLGVAQSEFQRAMKRAEGSLAKGGSSAPLLDRRAAALRGQLQARAREIVAERSAIAALGPKRIASQAIHRGLERLHRRACSDLERQRVHQAAQREDEELSDLSIARAIRIADVGENGARWSGDGFADRDREPGDPYAPFGADSERAVSEVLPVQTDWSLSNEQSHATAALDLFGMSASSLPQVADQTCRPDSLSGTDSDRDGAHHFARPHDRPTDPPDEGASTDSGPLLEVSIPLGESESIFLSVTPCMAAVSRPDTIAVDLTANSPRAARVCRQELSSMQQSFSDQGFTLQRLRFTSSDSSGRTSNDRNIAGGPPHAA